MFLVVPKARKRRILVLAMTTFWHIATVCGAKSKLSLAKSAKYSISRSKLEQETTETDRKRGVGSKRFLSKKKPARAGWPRRLELVRVTPRSEVDSIGLTMSNRQGNLFMRGTFLVSSLSPPDNRG